MLKRKERGGNQNKENTRETGTLTKEYIQTSTIGDTNGIFKERRQREKLETNCKKSDVEI